MFSTIYPNAKVQYQVEVKQPALDFKKKANNNYLLINPAKYLTVRTSWLT